MKVVSFESDGVTSRPSANLPSTITVLTRDSSRLYADPAYLRGIIDRRLGLLVPVGQRNQRLSAAMRHALLAPGKRFRPLLTLLASIQCGATDLGALDAACAVEMVHAASLILDDLPCMDDAELRRGLPTVHKAYGEDIAILAAIGLLNRAYGVLAQLERIDGETRTILIATLSEAIGPTGLLGGQETDLHDRPSLRQSAEIDRLYHAKTGVLMVAAVEIGARVGGGGTQDREALRHFAQHLGIAFQTLDDLLDRVGSTQSAAKDVRKDGGKTTPIDLEGIDGAKRKVHERIDKACACLDQLERGPEPLAGFVREALTKALPA